ncbi:MAG: DUF3098 domain-containing protein [Flavisolibacter sp.]
MKTNKPAAAKVPDRPAKEVATPRLFEKENYTWMLIGLALLALGFLLMAGGRSDDPNVFNKDEIYSFRRITLAPVVILAGFVVEIFAIFRKPKA